MNIEKDLVKDGIIVTEKIDTDTVLTITKNISQKIVSTFPDFNLNADDIFSKLFSLNMYKANMPEGMAEANYCYKNSSIYFNSHIDGAKIFMGPEESMQIQSNLGSTIAMAFDECPSSVADRQYVENSVNRTTRWLMRCKNEMARLNSLPDTINKEQLLFGINQGAIYKDIRIDHAKRISEMDLDGYAVGGLAVGETHEEMYHILDETVPYLPTDKPTYLMGVGTPANILEGVERGIDFFDCVYPSRNGRHGHVYTNQGKINLFNQKYQKDMRPIEEGCGCPACRKYSRAYIRHLLKAKEMLGMRLCVLHNLYFYNNMMEEIRDALDNDRFASYKADKLYGMTQGENIKKD